LIKQASVSVKGATLKANGIFVVFMLQIVFKFSFTRP